MDKVYISKTTNSIKESVSFCLNNEINTINTTDKILLKPNFLNDSPSDTGVTTDLRVLKVVIEVLKEKGINNIFLTEAGFTDTDKIFQNLNVYDLENYGIKVINLENTEKKTINYPDAYIFKKMTLPEPVLDADCIITIPTLKTHAQTRVSLSIKNLFGFLYKPQRKIAHTLDLDKSIIDIYTFLNNFLGKKMFSLVDAIYCLSGRLGPNIGTPVKMDLLIGGKNLVNVDATCTRIMDTDPQTVRHLLLCEQKGLANLNNIETVGEPIDTVKRTFTMPTATVTLYPHLVIFKEKLFKKQPIIKYPERCTQCNICVNACPKNCITLVNNAPVINYAECIGCLCCAEGCPKAVFDHKIKNSFLYNTIRNTYKLAERIIKMLK